MGNPWSHVGKFCAWHNADMATTLWVVGLDNKNHATRVPHETLHGHVVKIVYDDHDSTPMVRSVFPGGIEDWCFMYRLTPLTKSQEVTNEG